MYYHPSNTPYKQDRRVNRFKYPKNLHHSMLVAYAEGGEKLNSAELGLVGYTWKAEVFGSDIHIKRVDLPAVLVIKARAGISQVDFTFDQNMRPFVCYVAEGLPYYYHFASGTSTYAEVALPAEVKFPRCEIDFRTVPEIPKSDIILGYTREGNLCYRIQRERFLMEHIIATDPKKTMLWRVGRTISTEFGYQWR